MSIGPGCGCACGVFRGAPCGRDPLLVLRVLSSRAAAEGRALLCPLMGHRAAEGELLCLGGVRGVHSVLLQCPVWVCGLHVPWVLASALVPAPRWGLELARGSGPLRPGSAVSGAWRPRGQRPALGFPLCPRVHARLCGGRESSMAVLRAWGASVSRKPSTEPPGPQEHVLRPLGGRWQSPGLGWARDPKTLREGEASAARPGSRRAPGLLQGRAGHQDTKQEGGLRNRHTAPCTAPAQRHPGCPSQFWKPDTRAPTW